MCDSVSVYCAVCDSVSVYCVTFVGGGDPQAEPDGGAAHRSATRHGRQHS